MKLLGALQAAPQLRWIMIAILCGLTVACTEPTIDSPYAPGLDPKGEAVRQDESLFTAKNNLVLARGAQRKYSLPVIPMDQVERAQLLHTMALSAIKQNDVETGKTLLREAIDTHPQHFEEAVRALCALEA